MTYRRRLDRILSHLHGSRKDGHPMCQPSVLGNGSCSSDAEILDVGDVSMVQTDGDEEEILFVGPLDSLLPGQCLRLRVADRHFLTRAFGQMLNSAARWKALPPTLGVVGMGQGTTSLLEYGVVAELRDAVGPPAPGEVTEAGEELTALTFGPEDPILSCGDFLVAEPKMSRQPPFQEAVLLLVRHDDEFTQALIVNKPLSQTEHQRTKQKLQEIRIKLEEPNTSYTAKQRQGMQLYVDALVSLLQLPNIQLRWGGDVDTSVVHVLHPFGDVQNAVCILGSENESEPDLYVSNTNLSEVYTCARDAVESNVLIFQGYAGWRPGQLETEIRMRSSWGIAQAAIKDVLWPEETSACWQRIWRGCRHEKVHVFELQATERRFQILGQPANTHEDDPDGWGLLKVRVKWLFDKNELAGSRNNAGAEVSEISHNESQSERPKNLDTSEDWKAVHRVAQELAELVPVWESRVKLHGREAAPGQLDWVKKRLGNMPSPRQQPSAFTFWAAALLNPLPALGVAREIRPSVLAEKSILTRIILVRDAFRSSIDGLGGQEIVDVLKRFEAVVCKPEADICLLQAAALIGSLAESCLDIEQRILLPVAQLGEEFRTSDAASVARALPASQRPRALAHCLCEFLARKGFQGCGRSDDEYYNAENSLMQGVLETRKGLPISLSLLYITVGHAGGLELQGMNFPGHFLLAYGHDSTFELLDAFENRRLSEDETTRILQAVYNGRVPPVSSWHQDMQLSKSAFLERTLRNLSEAYRRAGDSAMLLRVGHCLEKLSLVK